MLGDRATRSGCATLIHDVIETSDLDGGGHIAMSPEVHDALLALRDFLYARVYENPVVQEEFIKAQRILRDLYGWCMEDPARLAQDASASRRAPASLPSARPWTSLSGMTDRFALATWEELFVPRPWAMLWSPVALQPGASVPGWDPVAASLRLDGGRRSRRARHEGRDRDLEVAAHRDDASVRHLEEAVPAG